MKFKIIIVVVLILLGNQKSFSQYSSIKGKIVAFETNYLCPGVTIEIHTYSGDEYRTFTNNNGAFELETGDYQRELIIKYVGCYVIKVLNIPQGNKYIDFGEIKTVNNYEASYKFRMDGTTVEMSEEEVATVEKMKRDVLTKYRLKIFKKDLNPYFEGDFLVFDFNKNGEK